MFQARRQVFRVTVKYSMLPSRVPSLRQWFLASVGRILGGVMRVQSSRVGGRVLLV